MYVYAIIEGDGYSDDILGVCSTEEIANKTVEALRLTDNGDEYRVKALYVDVIAKTTILKLEAMLNDYKRTESVFNDLKGLL